MLPQQPTTSAATNRFPSLIDRVLHLRRLLGIDIPLSVSDGEDIPLSPRELEEPSMEMPRRAPSTDDHRDWLVWSQSPNEGNLPEKEYNRRDWLPWSQSPSERSLPEKEPEELLQCQ